MEESYDFVAFHFASGHGFPDGQLAALAFEEAERFAEWGGLAAWAGDVEGCEEAGNLFAHVGSDFFDEVAGEALDFSEKGWARELPALHLFEAELPFTG